MIECNSKIGFGQPILQGRRLTVYDIVTKIYYEDNVSTALEDYEISLQDAKDAIGYCMNLKCNDDKNLLHYCDGCLLRTMYEGWKFDRKEYVEIKKGNQKITISKDGKIYFLGSLLELEDSEFGKVTWLFAEEIFPRLL